MKIDSIFEDSYAKSFFKLTCASLPYALALSSSIAGMMGYSVKSGLWLAAMLCILLIISNHVKKRA